MDTDQLRRLRRFLLFLAACAALIPMVLSAGTRPSHRRGNPRSYAMQLNLGLMMAAQDNQGRFPDLHDPQKMLLPYVKNKALFLSPRTQQPFVFDATLSGKPCASVARLKQRITFYEAVPNWEPTRVVAFADGTVRSVAHSDWARRTEDGYVEITPGAIEAARNAAWQQKRPMDATTRTFLLGALVMLLLCLGAAGTVAAEHTGWERVRVFMGYSLLYAGIILFFLAFFFPFFAQARESARMA